MIELLKGFEMATETAKRTGQEQGKQSMSDFIRKMEEGRKMVSEGLRRMSFTLGDLSDGPGINGSFPGQCADELEAIEKACARLYVNIEWQATHTDDCRRVCHCCHCVT